MCKDNKFKIRYRSYEEINKCLRDVKSCKDSVIQLRDVLHEEMEETIMDTDLLCEVNKKILHLGNLEDFILNLRKSQNGPTNLFDLEVGTKFRVINGQWDGEIVDVDGSKHVKHIHGMFKIREDNCTSLDIEIKNPKPLPVEHLFKTIEQDDIPY